MLNLKGVTPTALPRVYVALRHPTIFTSENKNCICYTVVCMHRLNQTLTGYKKKLLEDYTRICIDSWQQVWFIPISNVLL